ncbi:STM3941 family protein [Gracilibacillus phocaeensis]|uniref:STM3941 family protein n=1 Tax=Gracilibacillus phocaeensis TaxID=2042304 RepID=UPI0010303D3C|nr:STM3941 family protein [Gracilibacillus phocaeensis]
MTHLQQNPSIHRESTPGLYYYSPKIKLTLVALILLVFAVCSLGIAVFAFMEGDWLIGGIGIGVAILLVWIAYGGIKRVWNGEPYLLLTEDELIIYTSKCTMPIKWEDIQGFRMQEVHLNKSFEVKLYNETEYLTLMSQRTRHLNKLNKAMKASPFAIMWGQVKRKDREEVVRELDSRAVAANYTIHDQMKAELKEEKRRREINSKYIGKAYGFGLILAMFTYFLFHLSNAVDLAYIVVSFVLYPFAKMIYDILIGFRFSDKMDSSIYLAQFHYLLNFIVYLFGLVIAPFGILYFVCKTIYHFIKKRRE